ncbi:MAG: hypothetical protein AAFN05_14815 [Pseudomonadota bacterium]
MDSAPPTGRASRILRGALIAVFAFMALMLASAIILWDADLHAARTKYEHARLALFGEWTPRNWCPPGRVTETCAAVDDFEAALEGSSDFTFFRRVPIEGTTLAVHTGIRFASARDVVDGQSAAEWCYLDVPEGQTSRRIDLARKSARDAPDYADLTTLSSGTLGGAGLGAHALMRLARTHCRFSDSDHSNQ